MSSLNNIISKILKDAKDKNENIVSTANAEKDIIISKKINSAKEIESEMAKKSQIEAKSRKERILSAAKLKVRDNKLGAKQGIIEDIFKTSIDKLCSSSKEDFKNFILNSVLSIKVDGDETLIVNEASMNIIDEAFIKELNEALKAKGINGDIKLSSQTREFNGGFILQKNGIEINNTYEALVDSLREELESEVAGVLFN
ncbi:V-type ATP synthase subunit E [Clostridium gasigenes]|uniref:V-type proton ATPase subunit E n=1 Tax=Clostridium gasigenes TaxID=94869 RepID=A0A1H0SA99_9CLOT|nr:V-type ATP synthase subunit E family protein [Clostridium gasigenes]MBB6622797.1 V-type ATP synthase subunit E [Clostridium gasigenes]MBU3089446.1 V-type ATP synthase subunit E [Clostridium gasigenes]MBU3103677.1 V-type ATP synthase subunit E [Clostridium gasigenes]MBU3132983.1 V-type ATP synthase subunit E [Clostridium gasigenes]MBU3136740.1 V-type ATP synthase subunit E [Clostridium gasigenes]